MRSPISLSFACHLLFDPMFWKSRKKKCFGRNVHASRLRGASRCFPLNFMSNFDFVPRKLAKKSPKSNTSNKLADGSRNQNGRQPAFSTSVEGAPQAAASNGVARDNSTAGWKGKGKETKRGTGKILSDEEYCDLLWLALSDHAIWSSRDQYEEMEDRDGCK